VQGRHDRLTPSAPGSARATRASGSPGASAAPARVALALAVVLLAGCAAARPRLYPNAQLQRVGNAAAERDIAECQALAREYGASGGRARDVATDTVTAGAVGAAAGAAGGAVWGNAGRGAASGAAGGAAAGLVSGLFRNRGPTALERNYVNTCLSERGYQVLGWE
jgi:hypothetical protein